MTGAEHPASSDSGEPGPGEEAAGPDPWRGFAAVMAVVMVLEAITVLLSLPVVSAVGGGLTVASGTYLIGLAVVMLVLAGLQRRRWAIWADLAVQPLLIAGFLVYPVIGFLGVLFGAVWLTIVHFRAEVLRRRPPS